MFSIYEMLYRTLERYYRYSYNGVYLKYNTYIRINTIFKYIQNNK